MRRRALIAIKVIVGLVLMILLAIHAEDARRVGLVLAGLSLGDLVLAAILLLCALALNALRWRHVLKQMGTELPLGVSMAGTYEGTFFNLFLPTGVGDDVVRAYRAYDSGIGAGDVVHSALIDRALGLWGLALIGLAAAPFSTLSAVDEVLWSIIGAAATILVGGVIAAVLASPIGHLRLPGWAAPVQRTVVRYGHVVMSCQFVRSIVPILVASNVATGASAWFALRSIGLDISFADATTVIETASLSALLPVTIGGWGVREGVIVLLLETIGSDNAAAIAGSAVIGLTILLTGLVGAIVWFVNPYRGRHRSFPPPHSARLPLAAKEGMQH